MYSLLTEAEIANEMTKLCDWQLEGQKIKRLFKFKDFVAAINFVNQLVEPAEAAGHHPDLEISYNKVTVTVSTHDAGGLTNNDFALAEKIDQIISKI